MPEDATQLEFATFEEIVAELERRFPTYVLATLRQANEGRDNEELRLKYGGSSTMCLGLLGRATHALMRAMVKNERTLEEGDDGD